MVNVFISYSWTDKAFVEQLIQSIITLKDIELWRDVQEIHGGDILPYRISKALDWCDVLILIWSKSAKESRWVKLEWNAALSMDKKVIPCILDNTALPGILRGLLYIDFSNGQIYNEKCKELLEGIQSKVAPRSKVQDSKIEVAFTSSDRRYNVTKVGIIHDTQTGLEWLVGPDRNISWFQAKNWVENIDASQYGTGWRMPTLVELKSIYESNKGTNLKHLDPVFKISNIRLWVWTGEIKDSLSAYTFYFGDKGGNDCNECQKSYHDRVLAVRAYTVDK